MRNNTTAKLVRAAVIGALYVALTAVVAPIAFGPVQFRVSEALCALILIFPEAAVGLTVGCFFSNLLFSTPIDVVLGTLATLISSVAAVLVAKRISKPISRFLICSAFPVVANGFIIPFTFLAATFSWTAYLLDVISVAAGEILAVYGAGGALYFASLKAFKKYINNGESKGSLKNAENNNAAIESVAENISEDGDISSDISEDKE